MPKISENASNHLESAQKRPIRPNNTNPKKRSKTSKTVKNAQNRYKVDVMTKTQRKIFFLNLSQNASNHLRSAQKRLKQPNNTNTENGQKRQKRFKIAQNRSEEDSNQNARNKKVDINLPKMLQIRQCSKLTDMAKQHKN